MTRFLIVNLEKTTKNSVCFQLNRRQKEGQIIDYQVTYRTTARFDRIYRSKVFPQYASALDFYQQLLKLKTFQLERRLKPKQIADYLEPAKRVVVHKQLYKGEITLPFLLALERVKSQSVNVRQQSIADGIAKICQSELKIPRQKVKFIQWLNRVSVKIFTSHVYIRDKKVAEDTARH